MADSSWLTEISTRLGASGVATVGLDLFPSELSEFLGQYFLETDIKIRLEGPATTSADEITISNARFESDPFQETSIERFWMGLRNGTPAIECEFTPRSDWTIPHAFPSNEKTFLDRLYFDEPPKLVLRSFDLDDETPAGLYLDGDVDFAKTGLKQLDWIIPASASNITGRIEVVDDLPYAFLTSPVVDSPFSFKPFELHNVSYEVISDPVFNDVFQEWKLSAFLRVGGDIEFEANGTNRVICLEADVNDPSKSITLKAYMDAPFGVGMSDLATLLDTEVGFPVGDLPVPDLLPLDKVRLEDLQVRVNPSKKKSKIERFRVQVTLEDEFTLIDDLLAFKNPKFLIDVTDPSTKKTRKVHAAVSATALLGRESEGSSRPRIKLDAGLTDKQLSGTLHEDDSISVKKLIDNFAKGTDLGLPEIDITTLYFDVNAKDDEYAIDFELESDWEVAGVELSSVRISFDSMQGDKEFRAHGELGLGSTQLLVDASFADGEGWKLSGSTSGSPIKLTEVIEGLIPGDDVLPDRFPEIEFRDLKAEFQGATKLNRSSFSFTGNATIDLETFLENPAIKISTPKSATFEFAIGREPRTQQEDPAKLAVSLMLAMSKTDELSFSTDFAWTRDFGGTKMREIQSDDKRPPNPPLSLAIRPNENAFKDVNEVRFKLVEIEPGKAGSSFFKGFDIKQWDVDLTILGNTISLLSPDGSGSTVASDKSNGSSESLALPFLSRPDAEPASSTNDAAAAANQASSSGTGLTSRGANTQTSPNKKKGKAGKLGQLISVKPPSAKNVKFENGQVQIAIPASIKIGKMLFETALPLAFDFASMAFEVKHPSGIKVMSPKPDEEGKAQTTPRKPGITKEMFGLTWTFYGAPVDDEGNPLVDEDGKLLPGVDPRTHLGASHLFTLCTEDFNYQIQQAPNSVIEVAYTKASKEPIVFEVRDFSVSSNGISISAEVMDTPVTLNGVDTKFKFAGSKLVIVDNKVKDLTLSGSGPLPPKLVGDAMVDISIQFQERDGNFTLIAGEAKLQGDKLLSCEGTRFQFQLDGIGLKFVNDGGFHLFFTLTGKARMVLGKKDSKSGALAMLPSIELELNECPLTGDVTVLAKHISFLVELPKPVSFPFLGAYEYELRAIGFNPKFDKFDGDAAMMISGQIKFAKGKGDVADAKPDLHKLYIGLPKEGKLIPQLYMDKLPLAINMGDAFKLNGVVEFLDGEMLDGFKVDGFSGEGVLEIKGLPPIAAAFGFFRVQRSDGKWVRAWFIYVEIRQISLLVPYVQFYLREIGLGFGYRYTLAGIKAADNAGDLKQMITELKKLSRTQGDLAKRDRWAIDMEEPGESPKWTIVLRAMFAQSSAATTPLTWNQKKEVNLPCAYLFDVVASFRSDLTFFMTARAWINTSYGYYTQQKKEGNDLAPLLSGFILLSVRQKRLLAHMASNPNGFTGHKPAMPPFAIKAIENSQFSATLLLEPGLAHLELGWPNMLRWGSEVGPLKVERRGGFIFRITDDYLLIGISYQERGTLRIEAGVDLGIVGASLKATADLALGARLMVLIDFKDMNRPNPNVYGAIGLDIQVKVAIELWIDVGLFSIDFSFSFEIGFSAALEIGIHGPNVGIRGRGTISVKLMGHRLGFSVNVVHNGGAVDGARKATKQYMDLGLEAEDVDKSLPGINPPKTENEQKLAARSTRGLSASTATEPPPQAMAKESPDESTGRTSRSARSPELAETEPLTIDAESVRAKISESKAIPFSGPKFSVPDYSLFVVRADESDEEAYSHFVLVPSAAAKDGVSQRGFLPVPPENKPPAQNGSANQEATTDFMFTVPDLDGAQLEHFDPNSGKWKLVSKSDFQWSVPWDKRVVDNARHGDPQGSASDLEGMTLSQYLTQAFVTNGETTLDKIQPFEDPDPIDNGAESLDDDRVQNPSESSYESAVRGAFEQFRGSPFFKHDSNLRYDRLMQSAFRADTSVYASSGSLKTETDKKDDRQRSQVHQVRSLIIENIVSDVQAYVSDENKSNWESTDANKSVAFQMGLVFRIRGAQKDWVRPIWLDELCPDDQAPKVRQRNNPKKLEPDANVVANVQTFNTIERDFSKNPPRFQQVRHYTDAGTIAITWKLQWSGKRDDSKRNSGQEDPEHHLKHYFVRRRDLEGRAGEITYLVRNADVIHRGDGEQEKGIQFLRPRFQIVDNFPEETAQDLANLPAQGRSYLYTITPVDLSGQTGFPLSLVATRYPNEPPKVPLDGKIEIDYMVSIDKIRLDDDEKTTTQPRLLLPQVRVTWTDPSPDDKDAPVVAIKHYFLVFRRQRTMPVGSYGLDSETQRGPAELLPTTNARILPTDIKIKLKRDRDKGQIFADISREELEEKGVFPKNHRWHPESWRVFIQTEAANKVPSPLAPVECLIRFRIDDHLFEERGPAEIEWIPKPIRMDMLPPEDQQAITGLAHVPMPLSEASGCRFNGKLDNIAYRTHPYGFRCIQMKWNQGPSHIPDYPLDLTAGYDLLELDVDAHTRETFLDKQRLSDALREIQEVQMLPTDQLALIPGDTLTTNQWEAWYPSSIARYREPENRPDGSEAVLSPWYSWRDSTLRWPNWWWIDSNPDGSENEGNIVTSDPTENPTPDEPSRKSAYHLFLDQIVNELKGGSDPKTGYLVDVQPLPAIQPGNFQAFTKSTTYDSDAYGWGILQRFGLSMTISLRNVRSGILVIGNDLASAVHGAINAVYRRLLADENVSENTKDEYRAIQQHLFVELLVQPGRSINLSPDSINAGSMLGIIQISLRPLIMPQLVYGELNITGPAGSNVTIGFENPQWPCNVINQSDKDSGQLEIGDKPKKPVSPPPENTEDPKPVIKTVTVKIPLDGRTKLFIRAPKLPAFQVHQKESNDPDDDPIETTFAKLKVTDEASGYFTRSVGSLSDWFVVNQESADQWNLFCWYAETLSSNDPAVPAKKKISLPRVTHSSFPPDKHNEQFSKVLPEFLEWSHRFFDENSNPAAAIDPAKQEIDPWLATAYARVESPAHVAPDKSGRLTYHHLLQDPWGHNYRYFVRPMDRYAYLWQGILESPILFPRETVSGRGARRIVDATNNVTPETNAGGLDVVLDRDYPVDMPVVLSSRRLDIGADNPGTSVTPGATWEVIVAKHREQDMIERNQTLARRLGFRHISYALQRRYIFDEWAAEFVNMLSEHYQLPHEIEVQIPEDYYPDIPGSYPKQADHLAIGLESSEDKALSVIEATSLDLPNRINSFQQGALVLQWEGLPFFYEHRLLLIAQTSTVVSPINSITQRDFEYRSPKPTAWIANNSGLLKTDPTDSRELELILPLCRFWDSLPEAAEPETEFDKFQNRWLGEKPLATDTHRKPASLPDKEVEYQLVAVYAGNIETQAIIKYDENASNFVAKKLGRLYEAILQNVILATGQHDAYSLRLSLGELSEITLLRKKDSYELDALGTTKNKVRWSENENGDGQQTLIVDGVLKRADRNNLLVNSIPEMRQHVDNPGVDDEAAEAFLEQWYGISRMSLTPEILLSARSTKIRFHRVIQWSGELGTSQKQALTRLVKDADENTRDSLNRIIARLNQSSSEQEPIIAPRRLLKSIPEFPDIQFSQSENTFIWAGEVSAKAAKKLRNFMFDSAVDRLVNAAEEVSMTVALGGLTDVSQSEIDKLLGEDANRLSLFQPKAANSGDLSAVWTSLLGTEPLLKKLEKSKSDVSKLAALIRQQAASQTIEVNYCSNEDIPKDLKDHLDFEQGLIQATSPLNDDEIARLKSVFNKKDHAAIDQLVLDLQDRKSIDQAYQCWLYETPIATAPDPDLMPENSEVIETSRYIFAWSGESSDDDISALKQLEGDESFESAINRLISKLESRAIESENNEIEDQVKESILQVSVSVPTGTRIDLPSDMPDSLTVSNFALQHHGHMSESETTSLKKLFGSSSDKESIDRLAKESNLTRRGVELFVMTRRGSAAPSKMIPVEEFDATSTSLN